MSDRDASSHDRIVELLVRLGLALDGEVSGPAALDAMLERLAALSPELLRARLGGAATLLGASGPVPAAPLRSDESAELGAAAVAGVEPHAPLRDGTILAAPDSTAGGGDGATRRLDRDRARSSPSQAASASAAGTPLGRYLLLERLGVGGMGVVWKAWDPELGRVVALKQIRKGDDFGPEHVARFQREARLAAKLRHPNIVAVHDVGTVDDEHYLTMEFVDGRTLANLLEESRARKCAGDRVGMARLRDEVRLLAEVAEAVAYAHGQGVVHRDLKPGNVLLDKQDRPYVTDFGLAKEVAGAPDSELAFSNPTLTAVGQVVGTPDYMAPEQAESQHDCIGPRSDVWALGIMLYETLTGRTPFDAERGWRTLVRVIHDEPARPRRQNPHAPEELEAICLKAIEKQAALRYATADAFAAELRRWLKGEPVEARRYGPAYRGWRWGMRRKPSVAAAVASLALIAWALASQALVAQAHARLLGRLRSAARTSVDGALAVRRMGLLAAMESHRPALEAAYRDAVAELGDSSPEPAYAMGRFARATLRDGEARDWQAKALAIDPRHPPSLYEAAVLEAREYARLREKARDDARAERGALLFGGRTPEPDAAHEVPADPARAEMEARVPALRASKERLIALLRALDEEARAGRAAAAGVGPAPIEAVAALLAVHSGRDNYEAYDAARPRFEAAIAGDPSLEEAYHAWADAALACARWAESAEICTRGIAADRGYLPLRVIRGRARLLDGVDRLVKGEDCRPLMEAAVADFRAVVELAPDHAAGWAGLGCACMNLAIAAGQRGGKVDETLRAAIGDFDRALALDDRDRWSWFGRGNARLNLANAESDGGADGGPLAEAAIADFTRALALDAGFVEGWKNRGTARMSRAHSIAARGGDATEAFQEALEDYSEAIRRWPADPGAWKFRGMAQLNQAMDRRVRGQDPAATLEAAVRDLGKAVELDANDAEAWQSLGKTLMNRAAHLRQSGGDPDPDWTAAAEACGRALAANPSLTEAWLTRGNVRMNRGTQRLTRGEDPSADYGLAASDYEKAVGLNPADAGASRSLATMRANWGAWKLKQGEDPEAVLAAAVADMDQALARNPTYAEGWVTRGIAHTNAGLWREKQGADPSAPYGEAERDFTRALEINPVLAEARLNRGRVRMRWGTDRGQRGGDPVDLFRGALADLDECLKAATVPAQVRGWRDQIASWLAQFGGPGGQGKALSEWGRRCAEAESALQAGRWPEATRLYAEVLAQAPAAPAPAEREVMAGAHYNMACLLAQGAAGIEAPGVRREVGVEEAARLRDQAFGHLNAAVDLGWKDADHARQDPDLEPLRADARWSVLLKRM